MTREHWRTMLPVIQAFVEHKAVEYFDNTTKTWLPVDREYFTLGSTGFRIVPETRTLWLNVYPGGATFHYPTREAADQAADPSRIACIEVKYKEGDGLP